MTVHLTYVRLDSPIGGLRVALLNDRIVAVDFVSAGERMERLLSKRFKRFALVDGAADLSCLSRYFDGDVAALDRVEPDLQGTEFQLLEWRALRSIPVGTLFHYSELAAKLGRPTATRAVARANALNPVSIIVPCHRLIGADGSLTGYAGGLAAKQWLIDHEASWARMR